MAQFDVYAIHSSQDLLLDVQANALYSLSSRMIIPLVLKNPFFTPAPRLNPEFRVNDEIYVMITHLMTSVPASQLHRPIANLASKHDQISSALDMLFLGF
jgi:toxin CcdB